MHVPVMHASPEFCLCGVSHEVRHMDAVVPYIVTNICALFLVAYLASSRHKRNGSQPSVTHYTHTKSTSDRVAANQSTNSQRQHQHQKQYNIQHTPDSAAPVVAPIVTSKPLVTSKPPVTPAKVPVTPAVQQKTPVTPVVTSVPVVIALAAMTPDVNATPDNVLVSLAAK